MLRKTVLLIAVVVFSLQCQAQAKHTISRWRCGEGFWNDPNNWEPNTTHPNNIGEDTFDVIIECEYAKLRLTSNIVINQLDSNCICGDFDRATESAVKLTFTEPNGLTNYGDLEIDSGHDASVSHNIITIIGNVTNKFGGRLDLWTVEIDGNLYNDGNTFSGNVGLHDNLHNTGLLTIQGEFEVDDNLSNSGKIKLYDADLGVEEVLDNNNSGDISGFGVVSTEDLFRNKGTIYAIGGPLTLAHEGPFQNTGTIANAALTTLNVRYEAHITPPTDVNNFGTIKVNAGGGVGFDCNLSNEPNGSIRLLGGVLAATKITQKPGATFEGFGGITGNVQIDPNATIKLTGPTNIVGDVNIPAGATLEISDGQTLITGHTTCDGTIHLKGGTVVFQGGCDCGDCTILNEAGIDRNHFDINADGIENFEDFAEFADDWLWQASWF